MRAIALTTIALILCCSEATAAHKPITTQGCVRTHTSPKAVCRILIGNKGAYFLFGRNLPRWDGGWLIRVRGTLAGHASYNRCPTRLIVKDDINVTRWKVIRRSCD